MVQAHALLLKNKRIQTIKKKKRDYIVLLLLGILIRSFLHMPKVDFHFQLRNLPPLALGLPQTSSSIPILVLDQLISFFFLEEPRKQNMNKLSNSCFYCLPQPKRKILHNMM